MDEKRGPGRPPVRDETQDARIQLRLLQSEKEDWTQAADDAGISLSDWMRDRLNRAAKSAQRRRKAK